MSMTEMSVLIKFIVRLLFGFRNSHTGIVQSKILEYIWTGFAYFVPKIKQGFKGNSDKSQNQFHSVIKRRKKLPME